MLPRVFRTEEIQDLSRRKHSRGNLLIFLKYVVPFLLLAAGFLVLGSRFLGTVRFMLPQTKYIFVPCLTVAPNRLERYINPPTTLMHNMSDEELLWAASFAPQVKEYPFKRVPKVAFMFLTRGPLPLSPLWEKFFKGNEGFYSIYIHSLPVHKASFPANSVFYGRQVPSKVAEWGKMSVCDAERRLLANALLDLSNEWFLLLSEACIPLYNFSIIYNYLKRSHYSYVGAFDDPGPHGRGRYNPKMAPLISLDQWRKGSQWFEVDRELAIYIVQDTKYYSKFTDFCKPPCYVDEHYFPTMLHIEAPNKISNRSLTFVDWSRGGAHPATFGKGDISEEFFRERFFGDLDCIYNGQHSSLCVLFARKFAPSALEPLLQLASTVLGFG
ncbi:hypothetical protein HPP92_017258 [Vanilla planifolia]|uniref:Core-2/I-branching beta-1,6-N-acetylglucosaminyltransferase family protein n=1 Tax=Vanilla planifolia TaxID=51239 RepID=A0A835Q7N9_VANPL|nr:hypothetical protein HPP92_017258 [Vanilla planifolia]